MNSKLLIIIPLLIFSVVGCKQTPESQLARIESQERIQQLKIEAAERTRQREIEARRQKEREQVAHEQKMKKLSNTFWSFALAIFLISATILLFKAIAGSISAYIERQKLIKEMRLFEIEKEMEASVKKYKIALKEVTKLLPLLSPDERRALFENGGLLAKDTVLKLEKAA